MPSSTSDRDAPPPVSVVIPVHNEVDVIEDVVRGFLDEVVAKMPEAELVVAEDGSTDGTKELLASLADELDFRLVQGAERKGYLRGLQDALLAARGQWVFYCDSDATHDPADFWALWDAREDADVVAGVKRGRKDPFYRKIASWFYNRYISVKFGFRVRDSNAGFKLLRGQVVDEVVPEVTHLKLGFSTELLVRAHAHGYRMVQVPVRHFERPGGEADQFPLTRMPKIGWQTYRGLRRLKKDVRRIRKGRKPHAG